MKQIIETELVLQRVPPGDNWRRVTVDSIGNITPFYGPNEDVIYNSLTEALNAVFESENIVDFHVSAGTGKVYAIFHVEYPADVVPVVAKKLSIYGD